MKSRTISHFGGLDLFSAYDRDFAALDVMISAVEAARAGKIHAPNGERSIRAWLATRAIRQTNATGRELIKESRLRAPWLVHMPGDGFEDGGKLIGCDELPRADLFDRPSETVDGWRLKYDPLTQLLLEERRRLLDVNHTSIRAARIVALWRDGLKYREIAKRLRLSDNTVKKTLELYRGAVRERARAMGYSAVERAVLKNL